MADRSVGESRALRPEFGSPAPTEKAGRDDALLSPSAVAGAVEEGDPLKLIG